MIRYRGSTLLRKILEILQKLVELMAGGILKDKKNTGFIVKPSKEPKDIGVGKAMLDLYLSAEVAMVPILVQFLLEYDLQSHHVSTLRCTLDD